MKLMRFLLFLVCLNSFELQAKAVNLIYPSRLMSDPFLAPEIESCEVFIQQIKHNLTQWKLKGILVDDDHYTQLWFADNQDIWLFFHETELPLSLSPWQIITVSSNNVLWQAALPDYCQTVVTMENKIKGY